MIKKHYVSTILFLYCSLMIFNSYVFYNMMINYTDGMDILYDLPLSAKQVAILLIIQFLSSIACIVYLCYKNTKINRVDG